MSLKIHNHHHNSASPVRKGTKTVAEPLAEYLKSIFSVLTDLPFVCLSHCISVPYYPANSTSKYYKDQ